MRLRRDERGVSGFLVAGSMLLLMGVAAISIDISSAYTERRQDQTAADAGAQSAGVAMIQGVSLQQVVQVARDTASTNLGGRVLNWAGCTDAQALPVTSSSLGLSNGTPCISFGNNSDGVAFARIRVRIPDQATPTTFGRVLGAMSITTSASAIIELGGTTPYRNFPSFVFAPAGPGDRYCVRTGPGTSNSENCVGSTTGNFGMFLPYFYSNAVGLQCTSGNQSAPNAYAIAEGVDHLLAANPGLANPPLENGADTPCPPAGPVNPNQIRFSSGNNPNVTDGLIKGANSPTTYTGRLTRRTWGGSATIFGYQIDNRPLWSYIDDAMPGLSGPCQAAAGAPNNATGPVDPVFDQAMADMVQCLRTNPPVGLLGADTNSDSVPDIYQSPRVTTVPKLFQSAPCGSASCVYDIIDFVPIFLESLYTNTGPQWTCNGTVVQDAANGFCRHDAGRTGAISVGAAGQQVVRSVAGIVLSCDVLPGPGSGQDKCKLIGSGVNTTTTFLNLSFLE